MTENKVPYGRDYGTAGPEKPEGGAKYSPAEEWSKALGTVEVKTADRRIKRMLDVACVVAAPTTEERIGALIIDRDFWLGQFMKTYKKYASQRVDLMEATRRLRELDKPDQSLQEKYDGQKE